MTKTTGNGALNIGESTKPVEGVALILVNAEYAGHNTILGPDGKFYTVGENAFANMKDAAPAITAETLEVRVTGKVSWPGNQTVDMSAATGKNTITFNDITDGSVIGAYRTYIKGNGSTVVVFNNVNASSDIFLSDLGEVSIVGNSTVDLTAYNNLDSNHTKTFTNVGKLTVTEGSTCHFADANQFGLGDTAISGAGTIKSSGTLIVSGDNSQFTGVLEIANGVVMESVQSGFANASQIINNGTMQCNAAGTFTYDQTIVGNGMIKAWVQNAGTEVVLTGDISGYTGQFDVVSGNTIKLNTTLNDTVNLAHSGGAAGTVELNGDGTAKDITINSTTTTTTGLKVFANWNNVTIQSNGDDASKVLGTIYFGGNGNAAAAKDFDMTLSAINAGGKSIGNLYFGGIGNTVNDGADEDANALRIVVDSAYGTIVGGGQQSTITGDITFNVVDGASGAEIVGAGDGNTVNGNIFINVNSADDTSVGNITSGRAVHEVSGDIAIAIADGKVGNVYGLNSGDANGTSVGNIQIDVTGGTVSTIRGGNSSSGKVPGTFEAESVKINLTGGEVTGKIYGGSQLAADSIAVVVDGGQAADIYAGSKYAAVGTASIEVKNGTVGSIYGGGAGGTDDIGYSTVETSAIRVSGGTVNGDIYGGGTEGDVTTSATVTITGGTITSDIYGGGYGEATVKTAEVVVSGDTVTFTEGKINIYGGGNGSGEGFSGSTNTVESTSVSLNGVNQGDAMVYVYGGGVYGTQQVTESKVTVTDSSVYAVYGGTASGYGAVETAEVVIDGSRISSDVYGGGAMATATTGSSSVKLTGGSVVSGDVYGGGFNGGVTGDVAIHISGATVNGDVNLGVWSGDATVGGAATLTISGGNNTLEGVTANGIAGGATIDVQDGTQIAGVTSDGALTLTGNGVYTSGITAEKLTADALTFEVTKEELASGTLINLTGSDSAVGTVTVKVTDGDLSSFNGATLISGDPGQGFNLTLTDGTSSATIKTAVDTILANSNWAGYAQGSVVFHEDKFYEIGTNAFDNLNTAIAGMADDTVTISIAAGNYGETSAAQFTDGVAIVADNAVFTNTWSFGINSDIAASFDMETAEKFTVSGTLKVGQFYAEKNANVYVVVDGDLTTVGSFGAKLATQVDVNGTVTVTPPSNGASQVLGYGTMNVTGKLDSTSGSMGAVMVIGTDSYDETYGKGGVLNVTGENASVTLRGNTGTDMPVMISGLSSLNISDGGSFTHEDGSLENKGTVNVDKGTLSIKGTVENSGTMNFTDAVDANTIANSGTMNFSGKSSFSGNAEGIDNSALIQIIDGTLTLDGGSFSNRGNIHVGDFADSTAAGSLKIVNGASVTTAGTIYIGTGTETFGANASILELDSTAGEFKINNGIYIREDGKMLVNGHSGASFSNVNVGGEFEMIGANSVSTGISVGRNTANGGPAVFHMKDSTLTDNAALTFGYKLNRDAEVTLENSHIIENSTQEVAFGVGASGGYGIATVTMTGSSLKTPGAVSIGEGSSVTLQEASSLDAPEITNNGTLSFSGSSLTATKGTVINNGVLNAADSSLKITRSSNTGGALINNSGAELVLDNTAVFRSGSAATKYYGVWTLDNAGTIKLTNGSYLGAYTLTNSGSITLDYTSTLGLTNYSGAGSVTVDTTGYTGGAYKLFNDEQYTGTWTVEDYQTLLGEGNWRDDYYVIGGDLILTDADMTNFYVNTAWSDLEEYDAIEGHDKVYYGLNAYDIGSNAILNAINSGSDVTVHLESDAGVVSGGHLGVVWRLNNNTTTITADEARTLTLPIGQVTASGFYLEGNGNLVFGKNVTVHWTRKDGVGDQSLYFGSVAGSDTLPVMEVKGAMIVDQSFNIGEYQVDGKSDAAGELIIHEGASLSVGEQFVMRGNGAALDLKDGATASFNYATIYGGELNATGATLESKAFVSISWLPRSNGESYGTTFAMNLTDSTFTVGTNFSVTGGDSAYQAEVTLDGSELIVNGEFSSDRTVSLTNDSTLELKGLATNGGILNVNDSALNVSELASTGEINVSGTSTLNIGTLTGEVDLLDGAVLIDSTVGGKVVTEGDVTVTGTTTLGQLVLKGARGDDRTIVIGENANVSLGHLDVGSGLPTDLVPGDMAERAYYGHVLVDGKLSVDKADQSGAIYIRPYAELVVTGTLDVKGEVHNRGSLVVDGGAMTMSAWETPKLLGYTTGDRLTVTNSGTMTVLDADAVTFGEASASLQHMEVEAQYADGMFATISAGGRFEADTLAFANDDDVTLKVTGKGSSFKLYTDGRDVYGGYNYVQNEGRIIVDDQAVFDVSELANDNFVNSGSIEITNASATFAKLTNTGTLNVNGGTVTADNGGDHGLIVGDDWDGASGILNVTNGGSIDAGYSIQLNSTSKVMIDGGSMSAEQMYQSEGGELSIVNGGNVTLSNSYFAMGGKITVGGDESGKTSVLETLAGAEKRPASLGGDYTGHDGETVLNIEKNGEVILGTGLIVGHRAEENVSKDATVNVNEGGKLQVADSLQLGSTGEYQAQGVVNVNGGELDASAADVTINNRGELNVNGGSFSAQSVTNNGAVVITGTSTVDTKFAAAGTGSVEIVDATLGVGTSINEVDKAEAQTYYNNIALKGTVTITDGAYLNSGWNGNLAMGFSTGMSSGVLNIANGAVVSVGGSLYFGTEEADGNFQLNVSGEGTSLQSNGNNGEFYIFSDAVVSVTNGASMMNNARIRSGATYVFGAVDDTVAATVQFRSFELVEGANVTIQGGATADLGILVFGDSYMDYDGSFTLAAGSLLKLSSYSSERNAAEITVSGIDDTFSGVRKLIDNTGSTVLDYSDMIANWGDINTSVKVVENDLYQVNVDMTTLLVDSGWSDLSVATEVKDGFFYGFNAFDNVNEAIAVSADDTTINVASGTYAENVVVTGNRALELGAVKMNNLMLGSKDEAFTGTFGLESLLAVGKTSSISDGALILRNGEFTMTDFTADVIALGNNNFDTSDDDAVAGTTYRISSGEVVVNNLFYVGCADAEKTDRRNAYTLTVDGEGQLKIEHGTLNIRQDGVFNVNGANTDVNLSQFLVYGEANITDGAEVSAFNLQVYNDDDKAQLRVTDSTIKMQIDNLGGTVYIGDRNGSRSGSVSLENSALDANNLLLGSKTVGTTQSQLSLSGESSLSVAKTFSITESGVLSLAGASSVTALNGISNSGTITQDATSTITVTGDFVNNGTVTLDGTTTISGNYTSGDLTLYAGAAFTAGSITVDALTMELGSSLTLTGTGSTIESFTVTGDTLVDMTYQLVVSGWDINYADGLVVYKGETYTVRTDAPALTGINFVLGADGSLYVKDFGATPEKVYIGTFDKTWSGDAGSRSKVIDDVTYNEGYTAFESMEDAMTRYPEIGTTVTSVILVDETVADGFLLDVNNVVDTITVSALSDADEQNRTVSSIADGKVVTIGGDLKLTVDTGAELSGNGSIEVGGDVTVVNNGHLDTTLTSGGTLSLTNTSDYTLSGEYTAERIDLDNSGTAVDLTLNATTGDITIDNSGTMTDTVLNAFNAVVLSGEGEYEDVTVNSELLYLNGIDFTFTDGEVTTVYLNDQWMSIPGGKLTLQGGTVGKVDGLYFGTTMSSGTVVIDGVELAAITLSNIGRLQLASDESRFGGSEVATYSVEELEISAGASLNWSWTSDDANQYNIDIQSWSDDNRIKAVDADGTFAFTQVGEYAMENFDVSEFAGLVNVSGNSILNLEDEAGYFADGAAVTLESGAKLNLNGYGTDEVETGMNFLGDGEVAVNFDHSLTGDLSGFNGFYTLGSGVTATFEEVATLAGEMTLHGEGTANFANRTEPAAVRITSNELATNLVLNNNDATLVGGSYGAITTAADDGSISIIAGININAEAVDVNAVNISIDSAFDYAGPALTVSGLANDFGSITVTSDTAEFKSPYTLIATDDGIGFGSEIAFTVGTDSVALTIGGTAVRFNNFWIQAYVEDGDLKIANVPGDSGDILVNSDWPTTAGAQVDWLGVEHIIDRDASKTVDRAFEIVAPKSTGEASTITIVKADTYRVSNVAMTAENGVSKLVVSADSLDAANPLQPGDVNLLGEVIATDGTAAGTSLTLKNVGVRGNLFGGAENAALAGDAALTIESAFGNKFTGFVFGGSHVTTGSVDSGRSSSLTIDGGAYSGGYLAGGAYAQGGSIVMDSSSLTVTNSADTKLLANGRLVGGGVAQGAGASITQQSASITIDSSNADAEMLYLRGDIYAGGIQLSGGSVSVNETSVTFTGLGEKLSFTSRVSGGVYGQAVGTFAGESTLVFDDFTGEFQGLIQDFDTMKFTGDSVVTFSRKQTLSSEMNLEFSIEGRTNTTDAMFTVNQYGWVYGDTITITTGDFTTGTYVLADGYDFSRLSLNFVIGSAAYTLGGAYTDAAGNTYTVTAADNKLLLDYSQANGRSDFNSLMSSSETVDLFAELGSTTDEYNLTNFEPVCRIAQSGSDNNWGVLSNDDGSLVVGWGDSEESVSAAFDAFNNNTTLDFGAAMVSTDGTSFSDLSREEFSDKKSKGTLA